LWKPAIYDLFSIGRRYFSRNAFAFFLKKAEKQAVFGVLGRFSRLDYRYPVCSSARHLSETRQCPTVGSADSTTLSSVRLAFLPSLAKRR
jgi:hypothetical protein